MLTHTLPQMAEKPETSLMNFLRSRRIRQPLHIDRDEIERLTKSMKRESWSPPFGFINRPVQIANAYITEFGDCRNDELQKFGISPNRLSGIFKNNPEVGQRKYKSIRGHTYYYLINKE